MFFNNVIGGKKKNERKGITHSETTFFKKFPVTFNELSCVPPLTAKSVHSGSFSGLYPSYASFLMPILFASISGTMLKTSATGVPSLLNSSSGW
jgi:hypothetical protein